MNARDFVASTAHAAFATDGRGTILGWNTGAARVLGYEEACLLGKRCYGVFRGRDVFGNRFCDKSCPLVRMARRHEPVRPFELYLRGAHGEIVRTEITIVAVPARPNARLGLVHLLMPHDQNQEQKRLGSSVAQEDCEPSYAPWASLPLPDPDLPLTLREVDVLRLLCDGKGTREIADLLFLSVLTVRNHIQHILRKLDVHSQLEAVSFVHRTHLL